MHGRVFSTVLHWEGDLCVAECPEVGTVSQGKTVQEAIANIEEATALYLKHFQYSGETPNLGSE